MSSSDDHKGLRKLSDLVIVELSEQEITKTKLVVGQRNEEDMQTSVPRKKEADDDTDETRIYDDLKDTEGTQIYYE